MSNLAVHVQGLHKSYQMGRENLHVLRGAGFDVSGFCPEVQAILNALKTYGMFVADHGSNWYISGAPHPGWNDDNLHQIDQVKGGSFEVVYTGDVIDGE